MSAPVKQVVIAQPTKPGALKSTTIITKSPEVIQPVESSPEKESYVIAEASKVPNESPEVSGPFDIDDFMMDFEVFDETERVPSNWMFEDSAKKGCVLCTNMRSQRVLDVPMSVFNQLRKLK